MAKGDVFSINVKIDNQYKVSVFGVCDSALLDSLKALPKGGFFVGEDDLWSDVALAVDKYIPYVVWRNIIAPISLVYSKDVYNSAFGQIFPGLYILDDDKAIADKQVYFHGEKILPDTSKIYSSSGESYKQYYYTTQKNSFDVLPTLSVSSTWYSYSPEKYRIRYPFMVMTDDFLSDGVINTANATSGLALGLEIRYNTKTSLYNVMIYTWGVSSNLQTANKRFWDGKKINSIILNPDPYNPGGTTEPGGGTGDFDNTSDPVDVPATLPPLSASSTGFMTLYNPTLEQVQALANYMWTDTDISIWDAWMRTMANPSEAILGLSIVPVKVPAGENRVVKIGNISTGVSMPTVTSQYVTVDCGTLNVNEYWGAYLDYDPYTKAEIYLPYIGTRPLSVDDIMGKAVHVIYHIDIVSGACVAFIKCNDSVLYTFVGSCSCPVPTTNYDMSNIFSGTLSIATAVGSILATNGASAPLAVPAVASTAVNNLKPNIAKSGAMGSMGGMLAIQKPYLILTRPRQALPEEQNKYTGYPAYMTLSLSDCTGYTEIESIHLESVLATGTELAEIESLLKGGVIF